MNFAREIFWNRGLRNRGLRQIRDEVHRSFYIMSISLHKCGNSNYKMGFLESFMCSGHASCMSEIINRKIQDAIERLKNI